jgi:hypothetical protein
VSNLFRAWRIVEGDDAMDLDLDLDLNGPAHLTIDDEGRGQPLVDVLSATVDARVVSDTTFVFSWEGAWELERRATSA